jgi:hypothetical protein
VDLAEKGAVFVTAGKGPETLENFKSFLEAHNGSHENIRDISIDMSPAFISDVEEHFPKSRITFDKFHPAFPKNYTDDSLKPLVEQDF